MMMMMKTLMLKLWQYTGSGKIQMGFQMPKTRTYKINLFVPVKAGKLVHGFGGES